MAKYFKNIKSFEELKATFKKLAIANHPDNNGNAETMKEINIEFDALFPIWKSKAPVKEQETEETADSTRRHFYTQNGWEGSRYDRNLSGKEISKIIRTYIKEKYPTWKFSVTTGGGSYTTSINISLMEAPQDIFNREYFALPVDTSHNTWTQKGYRSPYLDLEKMERENDVHIQIYHLKERHHEEYLNDIAYNALLDIQSFANSYNFDDSDSQIDYFHTNFYLSLDIGAWNKSFKVVEKTARIKAAKNEVKAAEPKKTEEQPIAIDEEYTIEESKHTKTNATLWLVKFTKTLDKAEYIALNKRIKELGGYYSRFTHSFIFNTDPTEILKTA